MIETERLLIRYFRPADYEDLYEYLSLKEIYGFEPGKFLTWELGYIFNPAFRGRGYASQAAEALICHAFKHQNIHRVMARCSVENIASWKLLEKIGFTREGHFREYGFIHRDTDGDPIWNDVYEYSRIRDGS